MSESAPHPADRSEPTGAARPWPPGAPRIAMVAGEASGDVLAASVLRGLHERCPAVAAAGVGGPAMQAAGLAAWWPAETLSLHGFADVLQQYPRLWQMRRALGASLLAGRCDLFVGVDAPDFNLGLARRLRAGGVRTAQFVSPSIWAWRGGRIRAIGRAVDRMLLVFPFEAALYARAGIDAVYVGHPLADAIPLQADAPAARARLGLPEQAPVVALLPGSRASELRHLAGDFLDTARWLAARRPELRFVLPAATPTVRALLSSLPGLGVRFDALGASLLVTDGGSHDALAACDAALVASGTASLEAALFRRPMAIAYRLSPLNYRIMRRMAYLPWIGLPNILCRETVVPEFVQDAVAPAAMGAALLTQLDDTGSRERLAHRFEALHHALRRDCAHRAAEALLDMIDGRGARSIANA